MGPMQALVHRAVMLGLPCFIETIEATKDRPIVKMQLNVFGRAQYELLPEGVQIEGLALSRAGHQIAPRLFKDRWDYTFEPGLKRNKYIEQIETLCRLKPRSKALKAFLLFLQQRQKVPGWISKLDLKQTLFVPYYGKKPVFEAVRELFEKENPVREGDERIQQDCVTGEWGAITDTIPVRVKGIGALSSGSTVMSVNSDVTACYGALNKLKHHQVPVTDQTKNLHVFALQKMVDDKEYFIACKGQDGKKWRDGAVRYFAWMVSGEDRFAKMILELLRGKLKFDDIEVEDEDLDDTLCVLALREDKRLAYMAWHCVPADEVFDNIMNWANKMHRDDGSVLGVHDVLRSCGDARQSYERLLDIAEKRCPQNIVISLVSHIIENHPFPKTLQHRVRNAYLAQEGAGSYFHRQNQLLVLEASR